MSDTTTTLGTGGRIVIPGEVRQAMGLEVGDPVMLVYEDEVLYVLTPERAVARAQALVAQFVPPTLEAKRGGTAASLADALIAERRAESDAD